MKKILLASVASVFSFCSAHAETLQGKTSAWAVPDYKDGFQYTVAASRGYIVTK